MADIIFETIHGSHLYGLAHAESDLDWYVVTDSWAKGAKQTMDAKTGVDMITIGLDEFLRQAGHGVPQACDALFSPKKIVWQPQYMPLLNGMVVAGTDAYTSFERVIKWNMHRGEFKRIRHAHRLALNLANLRRFGRYSPVLTPGNIEYVNKRARMWAEDHVD